MCCFFYEIANYSFCCLCMVMLSYLEVENLHPENKKIFCKKRQHDFCCSCYF